MKYMGSKARFVKDILPIILKDRKPEQWFVEPFAGGMNSICEVKGKRIANDVNYYLIQMWIKLVLLGWTPKKITKEIYNDVRTHKNVYPPYFVGWAGFNCSYSGKWFAGFAGETITKTGKIRDYQIEALNNVKKQIKKMKGVIFQNKQYYEMKLPRESVIYCDPPYKGTEKYAGSIDHNFFWDWVRYLGKQGHTVFVSEYEAPSDFDCVWQKEVKSSLSANGRFGGNKISIERLFRSNK